MAKDQKGQINMKNMNTLLGNIHAKMDDLYKDTYSSDNMNKKDLDNITKDIEDNIDDIINRNNDTDMSNISKMYSRLKLKSSVSDKKFQDNVVELFTDQTVTNSILNTYMENKWVADLDNEIDTVCRYMTKLEEAIKAKQDAVLSSDCFSKDYLNAIATTSSSSEQGVISENISKLKDLYKLQSFLDSVYYRTSKYGEEFVYIVPYKKAVTTLLNNKKNTMNSYKGKSNLMEFSIIEDGVIVNDSLYETANNVYTDNNQNTPSNLKIIFDTSGILESCVSQHERAVNIIESGLCESCVQESGRTVALNKMFKDDKLEVPDDLESTASDGLLSATDKEITGIKVPGAIMKTLKHENIIPLYVDDICLGYYYLEFSNGEGYDLYKNMTDHYNNMSYGTPVSKTTSDATAQNQREKMLAYLSASLSEKIDKNFINANIDLKNEIYAILQHNDIYNCTLDTNAIRVTYLSPEDVIHVKFNEDKETHRGVSDIIKGLIPAKLYSCLYITNSIGILTRGQDKRVYYVRQNIEQNIAQTMMNTITQIKKSNFGIRQIENMNTILNITGRFNDFVIPIGQSGDSPIQFEVMQGQEFNPNTELMEQLEEMAISSTDIPLEFITTRTSPDFSSQITSTNAKVLRAVYARQAVCEYYWGEIMSRLYKYEYEDPIKITCTLPTPMFLVLNNMSQLLDNIRTYAESIANFEYSGNDDSVEIKKNIFIRKIMRAKLASYIKLNEIDRLKDEVDMEYSIENSKSGEDDNGF